MTPDAVFWTLLATLAAGVHVTLSKVVTQRKINGTVNSLFNFGVPMFVFGLKTVFWL
jgi:hypothetical protein